ncbi:MAG: hypothetical protein JWO63_2855, partial [Frankiales bacterium]|nr:hypothetical protein [Frankiales bacterium]
MRSILRRLVARPYITAGVAVVLVGAGVGAYFLTGSSGSASAATSYRLVAASTSTIKESISSSGTIEPATEDSLSFQVSGQVTKVDVAAGAKVTAGQVLASVNSASLQANLAQAKASLASDQAKVTADTDNSASAVQLAADNAAVAATQGQVSTAQADLAEANLTSPISGVVASLSLSVGQQVSGSGGGASSSSSGGGGGSGSTGGSGTSASGTSSTSASTSTSAQVLVISTNSWIVNATVDDTQVGSIAVGDQAQITADGVSSTVYGVVASVGLIGSSSSGVASYPVVVNVTGNPAGLHAGASGTVSIIYRQLTNVLTVPSTAVHVVNGKQVVYEMAGGKQVAHPVVVGLTSGGSSQITSGLAAGQQVVVATVRGAGTTGRTGAGTRTGGAGGA